MNKIDDRINIVIGEDVRGIRDSKKNKSRING